MHQGTPAIRSAQEAANKHNRKSRIIISSLITFGPIQSAFTEPTHNEPTP
jgi:hypothetical protein